MNETRARKILAALRHQGPERYSLDTLLGYGGSAAVYKATAPTGQVCAVKVYDAEFTDQEVRLERELSLRGHTCPNLVQIYAGGKVRLDDDDLIYLVMEFLEGDDLRKLIRPDQRFDDSKIRDLLRQLHTGASFLLGASLCHRDIKPENIRVTPDGRLVLLDLGVLKRIGASNLTDDERGRRFIATRRYTPPELQHRQEIDTSDGWEAVTVYQIGAVLYEMIQGAKLFSHVPDQPPADLVVAVDNFTPPVFRSDVGQDLLALARECLLKDPTQRLKRAPMEKIKRVAETTPSTFPNPMAALDAHIQQAEDRYSHDIAPLRQAARRHRKRAVEIERAITNVLWNELRLTSAGIRAEVYVADNPNADYAFWVVVISRDLKRKVIHHIRLCIIVSRHAKLECADVSGLGLRAETSFCATPETLCDLIARNNFNLLIEPVWEGVFDAEAFRSALRAWLDRMFARYFDDTASAYEAEVRRSAQVLNAAMGLGSVEGGVSERLISFIQAQLGRREKPEDSVSIGKDATGLVAFNSQKTKPARKRWFRR